MTTYTAITNAEIDQDSPVTEPLMTKLRDNPLAIAEGASGAPRIQKAAIQPNDLGYNTLNYSFGSASGTVGGGGAATVSLISSLAFVPNFNASDVSASGAIGQGNTVKFVGNGSTSYTYTVSWIYINA